MSGSQSTIRSKRAARHALATAALVCGALQAQERFVEDVQISRTDSMARVVVELACPMRFVTDGGGGAAPLAELRVAPFESCRRLGLGAGIASEAYRPVGGHLAHLTGVDYESLGLGESLLLLRFDRVVAYVVSQPADLRQLIVDVDLAAQPAATAAPAAPPPPAPPLGRPSAPAAANRTPLSAQARAPETAADFVINLQSTREPVSRAVVSRVGLSDGRTLYVSETTLDGQTWRRLRIGFFASEADAREALEPLASDFPRAWIGRAEPAEIDAASRADLEPGAVVSAAAEPSDRLPLAATPRGNAAAGIDAAQIDALMGSARDSLLDGRYSDAVSLYTQLLAEPGAHQQQAREYLGVAREKLGQIDRAVAEYRAYLSEYPDDPGTARVQQRLDSLLTAPAAPKPALRAARAGDGPAWELVTGLAQYYRRDVDRLDGSDEDFVGLSALQSDIDLSARRSGGRFDLLSRFSASHFYDLIGEENNGPGDQTRITYGYLDMIDTERDWSLRLGRQSLHQWGVLGRFDGAHLSYGWRPERRLHLTTGYPVETTRNGVETDRRFVGLAADFEQLIGEATLSVFLNEQRIEGIEARRAVGTEVHYAGERGNVTGMIDYDVGYSELNSVLALGAYRFARGTTVSALLDFRKSPILTTRNALIGQPVTTIDELLLVWTEDEIRQLAADRTAQSKTLTVGASQPLGERFQLNADLTTTQIDGTAASGGVAAIPGTGPQTYLTTSLVGTGIFGKRDVNMLNIRYGEGDGFETAYLTWDARFPIGRRLRLNPRLRVAIRDDSADETTRETVGLALRLLLNTPEHYRFELEIGVDESTRTAPIGSSVRSGYYLDIGYRASFY